MPVNLELLAERIGDFTVRVFNEVSSQHRDAIKSGGGRGSGGRGASQGNRMKDQRDALLRQKVLALGVLARVQPLLSSTEENKKVFAHLLKKAKLIDGAGEFPTPSQELNLHLAVLEHPRHNAYVEVMLARLLSKAAENKSGLGGGDDGEQTQQQQAADAKAADAAVTLQSVDAKVEAIFSRVLDRETFLDVVFENLNELLNGAKVKDGLARVLRRYVLPTLRAGAQTSVSAASVDQSKTQKNAKSHKVGKQSTMFTEAEIKEAAAKKTSARLSHLAKLLFYSTIALGGDEKATEKAKRDNGGGNNYSYTKELLETVLAVVGRRPEAEGKFTEKAFLPFFLHGVPKIRDETAQRMALNLIYYFEFPVDEHQPAALGVSLLAEKKVEGENEKALGEVEDKDKDNENVDQDEDMKEREDEGDDDEVDKKEEEKKEDELEEKTLKSSAREKVFVALKADGALVGGNLSYLNEVFGA